MLSVWWDWKGVVFFELLPRNQTINLDVYCLLSTVNCKGVIFYHDNATPHTSLATRQKLLRLGLGSDVTSTI